MVIENKYLTEIQLMESAQIIASFLSYIMVSSLLSSWLAHAQHDWGLIALALGWRLSLLFVLMPPAHVDGWFSYLGWVTRRSGTPLKGQNDDLSTFWR